MKIQLRAVYLSVLISPIFLPHQIANAAEKGGGDVRSAVQNPISSLISLPLKLTVDSGAANGDAVIFNINPCGTCHCW